MNNANKRSTPFIFRTLEGRQAWSLSLCQTIVQELCESRGGRPNKPSGFHGRKELLNHASALVTTCPQHVN